MKGFISDADRSTERQRRQLLDDYYLQIRQIILQRQDPITGLLPASTAVTVHGDYRHAWVRDNVYSILAVWGLALAYRRYDDDDGRTYWLEQSVVKLMRGLLMAMMKQTAKVEQFKHTQNPLDALHAKYDTRTGEPVVEDDAWGHLQFDATALFLLIIAQMTAAGLRIVFTPDEVDFIQNLVHYLGQACHTPDYGIWERGHKMNGGCAEINASSVGMVKAALEALNGFDLLGRHGQGGPASVIHVPADDIAQTRNVLEALLPRESESKETDAALLAVIGFPAYAVEDADLVKRTRDEILTKLQGYYGCKRFLRDGHQTVLEDHGRLHYESGELARFEHIESEWPLFFTYLLLDHTLRDEPEQAQDYRQRLEGLLIERDGQRLLPELYYVPDELVEQEKAQPGSQARLPNENVPLVWAQSLYLLGVLLQDGFIDGADLDPLGRRLHNARRSQICIQVALLAETVQVQNRLQTMGIEAEVLDTSTTPRICHASQLTAALSQQGCNSALGLSGRPPRRLGSLFTSQLFTLGEDEHYVFLPAFLERRDFYLNLDNHLLVTRLKNELYYLHRHWHQNGQPLLLLFITNPMLQAGGHQILLELIGSLQKGYESGINVRVGKLETLLPVLGQVRLEPSYADYFRQSVRHEQPQLSKLLPWSFLRPERTSTITCLWQQQFDSEKLLSELAASMNPYQQIELLGLLWQNIGPDADTGLGASVHELTTGLYNRACRVRRWGVIRRAAGLLNKFDEALEDAVTEILSHQHQLSVGHAYHSGAIIDRPVLNAEIMQRIRDYGGSDPREWVLIQELILLLGMLIKADPALFKGALTVRVRNLLLLLSAAQARECNMNQAEAFDVLLELSPNELLERLRQVIVSSEAAEPDFSRIESVSIPLSLSLPLPHNAENGSLQRINHNAGEDPQLAGVCDWIVWRETRGVLTRLPEDFHPRLWGILRHCRGLVIGNRLDNRNRLDSITVLADMTPAEKSFALWVEHLLNTIQDPKYRQLCVETLLVLSDLIETNPGFKVNNDLVLDVLIETAVRLHWYETHRAPGDNEYDEHCAEAWDGFYASPPHQVARAITLALSTLLMSAGLELMTAA